MYPTIFDKLDDTNKPIQDEQQMADGWENIAWWRVGQSDNTKWPDANECLEGMVQKGPVAAMVALSITDVVNLLMYNEGVFMTEAQLEASSAVDPKDRTREWNCAALGRDDLLSHFILIFGYGETSRYWTDGVTRRVWYYQESIPNDASDKNSYRRYVV